MTDKKVNKDRIRLEEMQAAIFRPKDTIEEVNHDEDGVLVFTIIGKEDGRTDENGNADKEGFPVLADAISKGTGKVVPAEDLPEAYAKSFRRGRQMIYHVKRYADGRLFNPMDMYLEHKHPKDIKARADQWKWGEVSYEIFSSYIRFLKTRNTAWLTTAQRELI